MTTSLLPLPPTPPSPYGLFLDVDGTLVDIAPRPDAVVVPPSLKEALTILADRLDGAVALISGRTVADLDRLFGPGWFRASGVHGAERREAPYGPVVTATEARIPEAVVAAMRNLAGRYAGTLVEDKRYSAAIHYRACPDAGPTLEQALNAMVAGSPTLRVLAGHLVYEIKHAGFDKGLAVERFMASPPFEGRLPIFIGDDVTDEPGLAAARARGGIACAVGIPRSGATHLARSPEDVRHWLSRLAGLPTTL